jgi:hypothetical protein
MNVKARIPRRIYIIRAKLTGLLKIGMSIDPIVRIKNMRTGSPDQLELLLTFPVLDRKPSAEKRLHKLFAHHHSHGEWFRPHKDILRFITEMRDVILQVAEQNERHSSNVTK